MTTIDPWAEPLDFSEPDSASDRWAEPINFSPPPTRPGPVRPRRTVGKRDRIFAELLLGVEAGEVTVAEALERSEGDTFESRAIRDLALHEVVLVGLRTEALILADVLNLATGPSPRAATIRTMTLRDVLHARPGTVHEHVDAALHRLASWVRPAPTDAAWWRHVTLRWVTDSRSDGRRLDLLADALVRPSDRQPPSDRWPWDLASAKRKVATEW